MFRASFVVIALASALALNGCSQCSKTETVETPVAVPVEATPVEAAAVPAASPAPVDGNAPAAPGAEAPAVPAATPAAH